ncbi:M56 family metallopeptidase [Lysinibacillus piscis]|uniref:Peptidase M56 domain-containing protein n=1 Tax=Lysinibacillus piscis TaxID=2518931 RepID=A0ABQ5NI06_9BACI|nr:M56 family metallopeptidase [Lysinibacillus sp. KH24]GLC87679.1 hypothetical protein LYSBPC_08060 [Lysinibacillus sp. KH24]
MQSIMVGLLFRTVVMTVIGLLFMSITPILLKRYRAKWLYYGWLSILLGFIFPFTFNSTTKFVQLTELEPVPSKSVLVPATSSKITLISSSVETVATLSIWQLGAILWIIGIIVFVVIHLIRHYRFLRTVNRWGQTLTASSTLHLLEQVKKELHINKEITLKESHCIHSPMLVGFFKHTIWLPSNDYQEAELHMIIKHELVHLKRQDLWYKAFVLFVRSIHWFNPLFYLFARELDNLCELSCDAAATKNATIESKKTYSQTILRTEQLKRATSVFSTNFIGSTQGLKKRIVSIMDTSKKKSGIMILVLLMLFTTSGIMASSVFAISSKPLNYLDDTFMKDSILKGASRGNFATDKFIIYPKNMVDRKAVPHEPTINKKLYHDVTPGAVATEARYHYPIEIIHEQYEEKYTTVINIEYDYELLAPIEYDELNALIEAYLLPFNELKSIPFKDFTKPNYLESKLKAYVRDIDKKNTDERVEFTFRFTGWVTNNNHLPFPSLNPIGTTPRYMKSTP